MTKLMIAIAILGCLLLAAMVTLAGLDLWTALLLGCLFVAVMGGLAVRHEETVFAARREGLREGRTRERAHARMLAPLRNKIVQGFAEPLLILDPARRVVEANRAAAELFGGNIVGRDIALYLRQPAALDVIRQANEDANTVEGEFVLSSPVERHFTIRANMLVNELASLGDPDAPPPTADDPPYFIIVALHDISKIKASERMRADFVANASHELRTPLSAMIGFIETLRGSAKDDPEAQQRFLAIMAKEGERMVRLIDDLLSLSRIELEKHVNPTGEIDVRRLLSGVAKTLEPSLQDGQRVLRIASDQALPAARGDVDQIHQVLQNLVANAIKYGRPNTPIELTAQLVNQMHAYDGAGIKITVRDQGEGIPPEHLPRLTERFYRVDTARSRKLGGTGLGLAIVKHIIERHRGDLEIHSTVGKGTTISVTIPVVDAASNALSVADSGGVAARNQTVT